MRIHCNTRPHTWNCITRVDVAHALTDRSPENHKILSKTTSSKLIRWLLVVQYLLKADTSFDSEKALHSASELGYNTEGSDSDHEAPNGDPSTLIL